MAVGRSWARKAGAVLVAVALCFAPAAAPAGGAPETPFRWIREERTPATAVRRVLREAANRGCDAAVFVFDTISFAPPPGRHEFLSNEKLRYDLQEWIGAILGAELSRAQDAAGAPAPGAPAGRTPPTWIATTRSRHALPVSVEATESIRLDLRRAWWNERRFKSFSPAERWSLRLGGSVPGSRPAIVLIASELPPEDRATEAVPPDPDADETRWRRKLLPRGRGFHPERVAEALEAIHGVFFAIAPEARFGDFLPVPDVPQAPWATRPAAWILRDGAAGRMTETGRRRSRLPGQPPDPLPPGGSDRKGRTDLPDLVLDEGHEEGGRFAAATPRFQRRPEFNTDCPSGYGWWPYARVAARTGGACLFYPFPSKAWADDCPRYDPLVDALAPETCSREEFERKLAADPIVAVLARAQAAVFDDTPWDDAGGRGQAGAASSPDAVRGDASSWFGFESRGPVVPARDFALRDVPFDEVGVARSVEQWRSYAVELRRTLARHEEAGRILDDAVADLAAGKLAGASRRSQANLRLARFWNRMSAFHLHALSIYLASLDRRMPDPAPREVLITYLPAVRLSDCLEAWDERKITWERERAYGWESPFVEKGGQGNFLRVPLSDPNYRARRDLDCVLLRLDDRLLGAALRTISAAEDVMRCEGRSAWGWVTYYAELHTFLWEPVPDRTGPAPQPGPKSKKAQGPATKPKSKKKADPEPPPTDAPPAGPGSGAGGASTGD